MSEGIEEWRAVVGYEGLYEVSSFGRVRAMQRIQSNGVLRKGIVKKTAFTPKGYVKIMLWKGGKETTCLMHRLVLNAFVGPCPKGQEGCHGNGVQADNRLVNLRWDTPKNNWVDRKKHSPFRPKRDLLGGVFGYLTIMKYLGKEDGRTSQWLCKCACGEEMNTSTRALISGWTRSCGCMRRHLGQKTRLLRAHVGALTKQVSP